MNVVVKFYANIALYMQKKEVNLTLDKSKNYTIGNIIDEVSRIENKNLRSKLINANGKRQLGIRILLNGVNVDFKEKMDTPVKDGDVISMFPLIGGG